MLHLQYILIRRSLLNNVNHNHIFYTLKIKKKTILITELFTTLKDHSGY